MLINMRTMLMCKRNMKKSEAEGKVSGAGVEALYLGAS